MGQAGRKIPRLRGRPRRLRQRRKSRSRGTPPSTIFRQRRARVVMLRIPQDGEDAARRSGSSARWTKSGAAYQPKCSGASTSPSRRSSSRRMIAASISPRSKASSRSRESSSRTSMVSAGSCALSRASNVGTSAPPTWVAMPSVKRRRTEDRLAMARSCAARKSRAGWRNTAPLRRQAHQPRRALDQFLADALFQPLQLHADCPLRAAKSLGRTRKALKIGDGDECFHSVYVQRHVSYPHLLSLK